MPSFVGASQPGVAPVHYTHDAFFEDLSRQMSISANRRYSRGSSNGALSGNAMRVAKPSSASNSPRNNLMQQRRRTMLHDPLFMQRAQQIYEQQPYLPTPDPEVFANSSSYYEPAKRAGRPVSWHPSTQQLAQTQQLSSMSTQAVQYAMPTYCDFDLYAPPVQMPPTPAAYSTYSSPGSAFSPLQLPSYTTYELPQTYASPCWDVSSAPMAANLPSANDVQQTPAFVATPSAYTPAPVPTYEEPSYSPISWSNMPSTGHTHNVTAPPTPEDPPKAQQPEPIVVKQEPMPYSPPELQENDEEEGDILIGLGLYDPPEKLGLLGASFEPTGKGLKLEDAWEPPASDDEEDDEEREDDGEGDAESEEE